MYVGWSLILKEENTKSPTAWWECAQGKERKDQEDGKIWIVRCANIYNCRQKF